MDGIDIIVINQMAEAPLHDMTPMEGLVRIPRLQERKGAARLIIVVEDHLQVQVRDNHTPDHLKAERDHHLMQNAQQEILMEEVHLQIPIAGSLTAALEIAQDHPPVQVYNSPMEDLPEVPIAMARRRIPVAGNLTAALEIVQDHLPVQEFRGLQEDHQVIPEYLGHLQTLEADSLIAAVRQEEAQDPLVQVLQDDPRDPVVPGQVQVDRPVEEADIDVCLII